jgi:hypothetical protein
MEPPPFFPLTPLTRVTDPSGLWPDRKSKLPASTTNIVQTRIVC